MDNQVLSEIGLTPGEIKTYLALLKLGSTSTGPIAKESGVSRSKLYLILDKLEKKGLVSQVDKKGVTYFQASDPIKIKDYMNEKEDNLKKLKSAFENFLPELESYKNSKTTQKVSIYTGFKGLITAHEHNYQKLKPGDTYYCLGIPKHQPETHHLYWQRDHLRRIKAKIKCQFLFNQDTPRETLKNRNSYWGCQARYFPIDIITPSYFLIYKDTIVISIPSENPISIEIISQEIADSFKAYFEEFWKRSKKFK